MKLDLPLFLLLATTFLSLGWAGRVGCEARHREDTLRESRKQWAIDELDSRITTLESLAYKHGKATENLDRAFEDLIKNAANNAAATTPEIFPEPNEPETCK